MESAQTRLGVFYKSKQQTRPEEITIDPKFSQRSAVAAQDLRLDTRCRVESAKLDTRQAGTFRALSRKLARRPSTTTWTTWLRTTTTTTTTTMTTTSHCNRRIADRSRLGLCLALCIHFAPLLGTPAMHPLGPSSSSACRRDRSWHPGCPLGASLHRLADEIDHTQAQNSWGGGVPDAVVQTDSAVARTPGSGQLKRHSGNTRRTRPPDCKQPETRNKFWAPPRNWQEVARG